MSKFLEMSLKADLRRLVRAYVRAFPYSYAKFEQGPVDFDSELAIYEAEIEDKILPIIAATASGITKYCNMFEIVPIQGFDEFKKIYWLGRAIEAQLIDRGYGKMAKIHMFTMIALMDAKLRQKGIFKAQLTGAMTGLIRLGEAEFKIQLGSTGCYLIYKCSSTAPGHYKNGAL